MRRNQIISVSVFLVLIGVVAALCLKPFIIFNVKRELQKVFKESKVFIGSCTIHPFSSVALSNIRISKTPQYDITIGEGKVSYSLLSLLKLTFFAADINEVDVSVNLGKEKIFDFIQPVIKEEAASGPGPGVRIENLRISDLKLNVKLGDLNLSAAASLDVDLSEQEIHSLDLKVSSFAYQGANLDDAHLVFERSSSPGRLSIREIMYNKFKIKNMISNVDVDGTALSLNGLFAETLDGRVTGSARVSFDKEMTYSGTFDLTELNLEQGVKDLDLEKRIGLTGKISGTMTIEGKGTQAPVIGGTLKSLDGGTLAIKDETMLENLARSSQQSLGVLVEGFTDYHYNIGALKLSSNEGNLVGQVNLEGEKGRRDLTVVLHNFNLK